MHMYKVAASEHLQTIVLWPCALAASRSGWLDPGHTPPSGRSTALVHRLQTEQRQSLVCHCQSWLGPLEASGLTSRTGGTRGTPSKLSFGHSGRSLAASRNTVRAISIVLSRSACSFSEARGCDSAPSCAALSAAAFPRLRNTLSASIPGSSGF